MNCIIGSFLQANEYYKASKNVNLQISPLLLYYGTTNLLFGMTTLINGTNMVDVFQTPTGLIEQLYCSKDKIQDITTVLNRVVGFEKSYLNFQTGYDRASNSDYIILRRKMNSKDIKNISFSGQPYLQAGNEKQGHIVTIPTLFNMYISLFIMSSLCRYHPECWGPFVLNDETGERLLFEKLMYFSRRMIPNFILNKLYGNNRIYVTQKYMPKETIKHVGEHEVKELIKQELYVTFLMFCAILLSLTVEKQKVLKVLFYKGLRLLCIVKK